MNEDPRSWGMVSVKFPGDKNASGMMIPMNSSGYCENKSNACDLNLQQMSTSKEMLILDETTGLAKFHIPLRGAKIAIQKFLTSCAPARLELDGECGI